MATVKDALNKIESHERECRALYKSIDKRLEDGSKRFDKLENMIWAVYPFIVGAIGWFIYKLIMRIVDGMETKLDTVDEKVEGQISALEERLGTKLDSQHGILVALIDRIRSLDNEIIRQDTLIKTILGVPQLIDSNKIAKADRDDQRKD
jgi:hypothetical protein